MGSVSASGSRRVAIVGYGLAGRVFHAPLVDATPGLVVAAVVTSDAGRAGQVRQQYPGAEVVPDVNSLFAQAHRFDLVVVASPNYSHVPLARGCIEAGLGVVIDKPLAATAAEGRRLVEEAGTAGVLLTVFQNRRWDGDFLTVRRLLEEGRLGRVHRFESRFERWRPESRREEWREDPAPAKAGGLLYDLGSHLIDQALVLFGPVATVYAELARVRPGSAVDDDVFLALTHCGGVRSHLWAGSLVASAGPRLRVLGDRAGATTYGLDAQESQLAAGARPGSPGWGVTSGGPPSTLGLGETVEALAELPGSYESFYAGVAAALAGTSGPPVDPRDAVSALEIIEAAQRSAAGAGVVELGS
jgi:predicted dehydrogenase